MTVAVSIRTRLGAFELDTSFESDGRLTALFGRSGAGKTSIVNAIAGLVRPAEGLIRVDDAVLLDTRRRIDVPVHRRGIGYVFQEARLFPHMSVHGNLAYGARYGRGGGERLPLGEVTALLGISHLMDRRPSDLSGGEKQRVAIGRALLSAPRLLLMDEPLASLDSARKEEILPYIERLRDEMHLPIIYVSHAMEEVARLADRVVLLADGKVKASGTLNAVFTAPDLRPYTGAFDAGAVLTARIAAHDDIDGTTTLVHPAGTITMGRLQAPIGSGITIRVRARDVSIAPGDPGPISIRNKLNAIIREIGKPTDGTVDVLLDAGGEPLLARITPAAVRDLSLAPGQPVVALIKAASFGRPGGD